MSRKNPTKNINIGLPAHVDAGKTTLSEALLYATGQIRALGRVDHQDAFLDTDAQERARGITIFSKQARLRLNSEPSVGVEVPLRGAQRQSQEFAWRIVGCYNNSGYAGACGFFRGDGAHVAGARLCNPCYQRNRWRAGTHADTLAAPAAL